MEEEIFGVKKNKMNTKKWKIMIESQNFTIVKRRPFKKISDKDFLELIEGFRSLGYNLHLLNFKWDGTILFERGKNELEQNK